MLSSSKAAQSLFDNEENLIRTNNGLIISEEILIQATNTMSLSAKAGKVALNALATAGNMLTMLLLSKGLELAVKGIDNLIHTSEKAREKSAELTSEWSKEKDFINENISKYKELKENLNDTSLSASEINGIKSKLLNIQDSLVQKYGQEAFNIDLVNGKYDEQIEKLEKLSILKASEYIAENYSNIKSDRKYVTEKININKDLGYNIYSGDSLEEVIGFDLQKYINKYDKLNLDTKYTGGPIASFSELFLVTNGTREEIYNQLNKLFNDLSNDFGESNSSVNNFKETLSEIIQTSFDQEQLRESKNNIKKYAEAEILSNNNTRKLYNDAINAVDKYNNALISGEGVEETKNNLDSLKTEMALATSDIYDASDVFNDIYNNINKVAETDYKLSQAFKNDNAIQKYAEQLSGLSSDDLLKIDFADDIKSPGEEAFDTLINIFGLSEEELQTLIDKLIEFGYIQKKVQPSSELILLSKNKIKSIDNYKNKLKELYTALNLLRTKEMTSSDIDELTKNFPELSKYIDNIGVLEEQIQALINENLISLKKEFDGVISEEALKELSEYTVKMENIDSSINSTVSAIDNITSAYQSLNKAIEEYNENGYVSLQTLEEIMKIKPEYLSAFIDENGKIKSNTDAYKELVKIHLEEYELSAKDAYGLARKKKCESY